jgi:serine/threonine protein kinase
MLFTKDDFAVIKRLGKGKYGDVFLTQHKHSRIVCALKIIAKDVILKEDEGINQFIREATIQTFLTNPYIIEMWGIFCDAQNMYLILEPALDGQLFKYMRMKKYIPENEAAGLIKQLCIGVEYLQS